MEIIPAIDIREGKCVRLTQGKAGSEKIYYENPLDAAIYWEKQMGAKRLHFVDLDGALGLGDNTKLIQQMVQQTKAKIKIQIGGGIRTIEKANHLIQIGADRVVIGTSAVKNPEFITELRKTLKPEQIIVSLDGNKKGQIAIKGWTEITTKPAFEYGKIFEKLGVGFILYSAIEQDGTFEGPDLKNTKKMVESVNIPVFAAGGTRSKEDVKALKEIGAYGVIIGKAFYEHRINFLDIKDI